MSNESHPTSKADALRSLRRKLEKLNRAPVRASEPQAEAPSTPPDAIVYRRDLPRETPRRAPAEPGICIPLEKCVQGREAPSARGPAFYLIEAPAPGAACAQVAEALPRAVEALSQAAEAPVAPEDVCFLDIETTGLGTALTFLIGTLGWRDGQLVCRQLLARTYAEEASILARFAADAPHVPFLVTFNGKTFDVPSLRARAAATGVVLAEPRFHLDLLHEARRCFAGTVPDCRLQTLERYVCQRYRREDIAGADIGRAYHDFVRTGDAREIALIVRHNQWDLLTMAHLFLRIALARET